VATVNITQVYQAATPTPILAGELEAAEQRLQMLPLDDVPAPAGLPPGSWMPLRRNALFVGREDALRALASALEAGGTAAVGQRAALTGLGGVGKSQLASEFVYRYGQYFAGGVFWLRCADPEAIAAEIATAGRELRLHADFANLPLDTQVSLVTSAWHSDIPRLLVLDNCEIEAVLERWLPRGGGCRVLVTSRRQDWRADLAVQAVPLGVLSRGESVALLCKHRPDLAPNDPVLDAIAEALGDLPLALHLAGSFLARYRHTPPGQPAEYLEAVRRPDLLAHRSLTIEGASPTGHEQHVARTFALSYDQLQPSDKIGDMALVTLKRAAWFAPGEAIPRTLLRAAARVDGADEAEVLRFEDGLTRLRDLGLISEQQEGSLALHRLLAAFVRSEASDAETHCGQVETVVQIEATRVNRAGYPGPLLAWQSQLRFVAELAAERESERAAGLLHELSSHLSRLAQFKNAKVASERALEIEEKRFGPDHPNVAVRVNALGARLHDLRNYSGAKAAYERALRINEQNLGPEHPRVATVLNNLGMMMTEVGDLSGAKEALERALRIDEQSFGPDHPNVARDVANLGLVMKEQDNLSGAKEAFERALRIDEQSGGHDHPNVANRVCCLGVVMEGLGNLSCAKEAFERALRIDEQTLGPEHLNVARDVANLGMIKKKLGDLSGAKEALERAFAIVVRTLGSNDPITETVRRNLESLSGPRSTEH
jgi:tetratricopeptide (TPR) repeat protein